MKRRLAIARAFLMAPDVIVLDEPTTGLDPQGRNLVWEKLAALKASGVTILMSTHYMEEAAALCDRIAIMHLGRILDEGTPEELIERHASTEVAQLRMVTEARAEVRAALAAAGYAWREAGRHDPRAEPQRPAAATTADGWRTRHLPPRQPGGCVSGGGGQGGSEKNDEAGHNNRCRCSVAQRASVVAAACRGAQAYLEGGDDLVPDRTGNRAGGGGIWNRSSRRGSRGRHAVCRFRNPRHHHGFGHDPRHFRVLLGGLLPHHRRVLRDRANRARHRHRAGPGRRGMGDDPARC